MKINNPIKNIKLFFAIFLFNTAAGAQSFDCSVLYDEFDSLMHKEFLISPENYVSSISGEISFEDFNNAQRGKFYLRKDRPEKGIGIIFTNDKLHGKFLFDWSDRDNIVIEDIIIYSRVEDGYAPIHHGFITLQRDELIDIDTGRIYPPHSIEEDIIRADLQLSGSNHQNPQLESVNEARVYFPTASLCR